MPLHRWILTLVSRLVPKDARAEWRAEWQAEISHRETAMEKSLRSRRKRLALIRQSSGAFWDALWLRSSRWYSLRLFSRHWRLALGAVLSLSVAIAATVIGLSAYDALLVRPPTVSDPSSLRLIHVRTEAEPFGAASFPEYAAYRDGARAFSDVAAFPYAISAISVTSGNTKTQAVATQVSTNFFAVLGIAPQIGMLSLRASQTADVDEVVIGETLWRQLGGGASVVGRTVKLNDQPVIIAGVAPGAFSGMTWSFRPDVWMSLKTAERILGNAPAELTDRTDRWLHMVGRLKPDVSAVQALADLQLVTSAIERDHPDTNKGRSAALTVLSVTPPGERAWTSTILGALILVVVLALVVACANVTNLLLGLSTSRRHEMLVRAALGASRLQLVMPLMRESIVLGVASGVIGYGAAWAALAKLATFRPLLSAFWPSPSLDLRPDALVLTITIAIAFVVGVLVGLPAAVRGASDGLSGALNRELAVGEPRKARIRNVLVIIQMAIASVVLVAVGVSIRSLANLEHVPLGFAARNLVFGGLDMAKSGFNRSTGPAFYERIRERLKTTPGIEAVTLAADVPLSGYATDHVTVDGDPPPADGHGAATPYGIVDDDYFSTVGMAVLEGRTFDSRDRAGRAEVVVINESLGRRHWPGRDPIGQHLRVENGHHVVEVIGVVPDGKYGDADEEQLPFMYFALAQHYVAQIAVIARTNGPRDSVVSALQQMDSHVVLGSVWSMTLDDLLGISLLLPRTIAWTTMVLGTLALALAAFGLYGTVFYSVSQRRTEIGIRTALGATPRRLFALVLRESGKVALIGAIVGLVSGLCLLPVAASIFYGIGTTEPVVLVGAALMSGGIAIAATYLVVRPWTRMTALDLLRR